MGFLKGSMTFSQYRVTGEIPADFNNIFDEQVKRYAFPDFIGAAAEKAAGWTDVEDPLDTEFAGGKYNFGNYLIFSLRIDKKVVPPALLRIKCLQVEKEYIAKRDIAKIHRKQREEIKEAVRGDLLKKVQPIPSFFEVCWHPQEKSLLVSSLSDKVVDDFHALFHEAFNFAFHPFLPWDPQYLSPEFAAHLASPEGLPWGREFLTWLWFKSEERDGMIAVSPGEEVDIHFVRRIVLASGDGDYSEQVVCQGIRSDLKEGKEALRQGKLIKEGRIKLCRDAANWEFTFKADRFQFQSMKLPEAMEMEEDEKDNEGKTLERVYLLEQAVKTMERLFNLFLQIRLSPAWEAEEKGRIAAWLEK
jgi:recombination associated protein RdgC